jgi:hypothetical protein
VSFDPESSFSSAQSSRPLKYTTCLFLHSFQTPSIFSPVTLSLVSLERFLPASLPKLQSPTTMFVPCPPRSPSYTVRAAFADGTISLLQAYSAIAGGWLDGNFRQLGLQLAWVMVGLTWTFVVTYAIMFVIDKIPGLHFRADEEGEIVGMDEIEHGEVRISFPSTSAFLCDLCTPLLISYTFVLTSPVRSRLRLPPTRPRVLLLPSRRPRLGTHARISRPSRHLLPLQTHRRRSRRRRREGSRERSEGVLCQRRRERERS